MCTISGKFVNALTLTLACMLPCLVHGAEAKQSVGRPGGNVLLYFVERGSQGLRGVVPTTDSWNLYAKTDCPADPEAWKPKMKGQFCASNAAARTFASAIGTLCDTKHAPQCRLLAGKYVMKGVKIDTDSAAQFWYFDGGSKQKVNVSAKSDRGSSGEVSSYANGAHMGGLGGSGGEDTCHPASDEWNYNDPREVPDLDGSPPSRMTVIVSSAPGIIYSACGF